MNKIHKVLAAANPFGSALSFKIFETCSFLAVLLAAAVTALALNNQRSEPLSPELTSILLISNMLPAACIIMAAAIRTAQKRQGRNELYNKDMLHVRLIATFSLVAIVPTILLVIFASVLFQGGVQFWYSSTTRGVLENSQDLAKGYYTEKLNDLSDDATAMAIDIRYALQQVEISDPAFLTASGNWTLVRKMTESAIVSIGRDGVQRTESVWSPDSESTRNSPWIDQKTIELLNTGQTLVANVKPDRIEAIVMLFEKPRSYLYTSRAVSVPSFKLSETAQLVLKDYETMAVRSRALQLQFNIALYIVSLLIIGITLWIALRVADRLVRPVNNLVEAAQRIAGGDLSARVSEDQFRADEVGFLSQSFNRMTERLERQTGALLATNHQLGERRVFIETVLESVSAGVVSVNEAGEIELANSTAEKMLRGKTQSIVGLNFMDVAPTLAELTENRSRGVVQLGDGPEPLTVAVRVTQRERGVVVTFEDISQQLADQRRAAWSDVARRIAHEIKNPLTPIQLAAERLQRRFGKQVENDGGIFEQLTATIIRQVGDLRNIVDEFSSFARMPKPVFRNENLQDIVGHAVFLFEVAHPDISFKYQPSEESPMLISDRRQLGQAFTNILKNAVESIQERRKSEPVEGVISVDIKETAGHILVQISDNGIGLPDDRDRIMEPYITNRATGSGLGLAIVKKIVEEHFGEIILEDAPNGGAFITLMFTPQIVAEKAKDASSKTDRGTLAEDEF
ncbi:MAG: ATP-binding protein [Sphingorhabdus sp.]